MGSFLFVLLTSDTIPLSEVITSFIEKGNILQKRGLTTVRGG
jgi:hypothetical protein